MNPSQNLKTIGMKMMSSALHRNWSWKSEIVKDALMYYEDAPHGKLQPSSGIKIRTHWI